MNEKVNQLTPVSAIHPGEILLDELEARDIKQRDFAMQVDISPTQLNEIIKGKRNITPELAVLFEAALKIPASYWMQLQSNYEIDKVKLRKSARDKTALVERWNILKDYVPIQFFKKQRVIEGEIRRDESKIKEIYGVTSIDGIIDQVSRPCYQRFRRSDAVTNNVVNIVGWIKLVEYLAAKKKVAAFSGKDKNHLTSELKKVFLESDVCNKAEKTLAKYGIKLIIQEKPDQAPIDGIAFWSDPNPAIGLTMRYKRIDNFAFTIFHELGHIYHHLIKNKEKEFVDDIEMKKFNSEKSEEDEANVFAQNGLIAEEFWQNFVDINFRFNDDSIKEFAQENQLHPAIIRGRLCHDGLLNYAARTSISYQIQ